MQDRSDYQTGPVGSDRKLDRDFAMTLFHGYLSDPNKNRCSLKKTMLTAALAEYGHERVKDCTDTQLVLIGEAVGLGPFPGAPEPMAMQPQPEQPYGAMTLRMRVDDRKAQAMLKTAAKLAAERQADARGDLFTVVAAYKPDSIFLVIKQGVMDADWHEAFLSQHTDAHMFLDPRAYIADPGEFSKLRALIVQENTGKFTGDVTVRVVLKKEV